MPTSLSRLREFRLLWIGGLFAGLGGQMSALALPLLVLRQTGSTVQAGAIETVSVAVLLITMLPGGALSDTVERRRLMRLCDVGSLLAVCALIGTVQTGRTPLVLVLLVVASGAVLSSLYGPAALGLLRAVVPPEMLGMASSRLQARSSVARLVGPLVGGALFSWHPAAPFIAEAVGLALSTSCLALMRTRSVPERRSGQPLSLHHIAGGLTFLWHQPYLRTILLVSGVGMNSAFSAMMFAGLAVASGRGHSGLGGGTIVSLTAAGSLAGALLAPRLRPDERQTLFIPGTCWVCAASAGALSLFHPVLLMGVLIGLCMTLAAAGSIGFLTILLSATPDDKVGRVQSAASFLSTIAQPLGPLAAGVLLSQWSVSTTFVALAAAFAVCAVMVSCAPGRSTMTVPPPASPADAADTRGEAAAGEKSTQYDDVTAHMDSGADEAPKGRS